MLVACYGYCMEMTLLLIHMKYQYIRSMLRLLHGNDIVINTCEIPVYSQHVMVVAWRLYHLHNFKSRAWCNTLPNRDWTCSSTLSKLLLVTLFSDIIRLIMDFVSSHFCWVLCKLSFYPCPHISCICGLHSLQSFTNCHSFLVLNLTRNMSSLSRHVLL